jgi:tRNA A-37 threonylcarbamoyl transferase component Bud32
MQAVYRIRGYDSFEQIAVGGMAVVYKARKQSLKKTVAIKVLLPHLAADGHFIARFQQEAEAAARITHDNIVNVIDYGKSDNCYYIVMEYYDGLTVEELLRAQPRLPLDVALSIVLNVCYGLEAAHAEKLVHRDIKPSNVIFTRQGGVKIADFGLAKAVDKYTLVTQTGKVVGTPAYMSPEQTRGEAVGIQSDIFSLGVVAYELLTGRRPFEGSNYSEVVDRIQNFEPPLVSSFNPLVDSPFESIVSRMLAKDLAARYATATDVVKDLEALMDAQGLRRDRRTLCDFFGDPVGYTEVVHHALLEQLSGQAPPTTAQARAREAAIRHYQKILYLDPADEGARATLRKLGLGDAAVSSLGGAGAAGAPRSTVTPPKEGADYKVVLESIDRNLETAETFALKLSMRLKAPLPRMRLLASTAPSILAQRLPYKKAKWLEAVITELGGSARVEEVVERVEKPRVEERAPGARAGGEARPPAERRTSSGGIICPRCGWEEEGDARFCSLCLQQFNKTDKIDVHAFRTVDNPDENPLAAGDAAPADAAGWRQRVRGVPRRFVWVSVAGALFLIVIIATILR